jgi:hypothetical protein
MPSMSIRELRDSKRLVDLLDSGEVIEIRLRKRIVGRIIPESPRLQPVEWPDFEARAREIFGDKTVPGVDLLIQDRNESRY